MQAESYPCYPGYMYQCDNPKPLYILLLRMFQNVIQMLYKSISRITLHSPQTYSTLSSRITPWTILHLPLKLCNTNTKASMIWEPLSNVQAMWFTPQEEGTEKCLSGKMVMGCSRAWKEVSTNIVLAAFFLGQIHALKASWSSEEDNSSLPHEVWVPCAQFYHFKLPVGGRNSKIIFKFCFLLKKGTSVSNLVLDNPATSVWD